jgi:diaminopimelate epimerase
MRFSRWHAAGNVYLLSEERLDAERVPSLVGGADGILEILARGDSWVEIAIWNPDGSRAEMSGNGTRIAARWLAEQTGATEVRVRVGPREIVARLTGSEVEQDMGQVRVSEAERIAGLDVIAVDVGNPHAVVIGDPDDLPLIGPLLETHSRFPHRTNVQVVRVDEPGVVTARVWERGVGETQSSGTSAVAVAAATHGDGDVLVRFPGGDLRVRLEEGRASLTGPAQRLRVPRQVLVYVHRRAAGGEREFLLLRRTPEHDGFWQGVSGAPEWGEPDEEAAVREVQEETGLDVSERLLPVGYRYELRKAEVEGWAAAAWERLYGLGVENVPEEVYAAEAPAGWEPTLAPEEHDAHRWCTLDEALELLKFEENREGLRVAARSLAPR